MNELIKITLLAALPESSSYPLGVLWRRIMKLHEPFDPPIRQGEILPHLLALEQRGFVTRSGKNWSRPFAGTEELEESILAMKEPWTPHKVFLLLAVGLFQMLGNITLSQEASDFIQEKMVLASNVKLKKDLWGNV